MKNGGERRLRSPLFPSACGCATSGKKAQVQLCEFSAEAGIIKIYLKQGGMFLCNMDILTIRTGNM